MTEKKPEDFKVTFYFTDGWGSYARLLDPKKHIVSKKYTQRIERGNLNLRTRCKRLTRKTICFSKSLDIHDKVIGTLIERIAF
ncbi:IS1 family transposase [Rickettsia endosymbiont of Cantharis rufa]